MNTRSESLLDGTDGPLDFTNVAVGRDDVQHDGKHIVTNTFKLVIGMDVANGEATGAIKGRDGRKFRENRFI